MSPTEVEDLAGVFHDIPPRRAPDDTSSTPEARESGSVNMSNCSKLEAVAQKAMVDWMSHMRTLSECEGYTLPEGYAGWVAQFVSLQLGMASLSGGLHAQQRAGNEARAKSRQEANQLAKDKEREAELAQLQRGV